MCALGGLLGVLEFQTAIFDGFGDPTAFNLRGGLLLLAGVVVVSVVAFQQRAPAS